MTAHTRTCPAPTCSVRLPPHLYACRRHWHQLPADVKRELRAAFAAYRRAMRSADLDDLEPALHRITAAQDAAEEILDPTPEPAHDEGMRAWMDDPDNYDALRPKSTNDPEES